MTLTPQIGQAVNTLTRPLAVKIDLHRQGLQSRDEIGELVTVRAAQPVRESAVYAADSNGEGFAGGMNCRRIRCANGRSEPFQRRFHCRKVRVHASPGSTSALAIASAVAATMIE